MMKKAIFGLGKSAKAVIERFLQEGYNNFIIINQGEVKSWDIPKGVLVNQLVEEAKADSYLRDISQIILSPGIPLFHPLLIKAANLNIEIISEIEYAFSKSKAPVIAITGSNGKTTCAMMISEMLNKHGLKVFLGGNIGVAYTQILQSDYDVAVIEVSSFQLETIKTFSPDIALITNITSGHTERYKTHSQYVDAKLRIFMNMNDHSRIVFGDCALLAYEDKALAATISADLSFSQAKVFGEHNKLNFSMVYAVCKLFLKEDFKKKLCQEIVNTFIGARFRCELIYKDDLLRVFNDGKSTSLEATISALRSTGTKNTLLILGGKIRSRDIDLSLIKELDCDIQIFGEARELFSDQYQKFQNLNELIGDIDFSLYSQVIFSPAFPSFDLYQNYEQRALHFDELILARLKS